MKTMKAMCMFTVCAMCGLYGQEPPSQEKLEMLRRMIGMYIDTIADDHRNLAPLSPTSILAFAQRNGIPTNTVTAIARELAEKEAEELEENLPQVDVSFNHNAYARATSILVAAQDIEQLPFLEKMSRSSSDHEICTWSAGSYIGIAGTNALPFIRKTIEDNKVNPHRIVQVFSRKLSSLPAVDDESLAFLYGALEKESDVYTAQLVDEGLCKMLSGYSNSVQRLAVAERFITPARPANPTREEQIAWLRMPPEERQAELSKDNARKYWTPIKNEIEKVPADKRKNFRAKGELLDPERK